MGAFYTRAGFGLPAFFLPEFLPEFLSEPEFSKLQNYLYDVDLAGLFCLK
jgi:hypothetical protein